MLQVTYLDCAAPPEDDSHSVHIDDHSTNIRNILIASSVFILGVHSEVGHVGGSIAGLGHGVGAASHVMMCAIVKGYIVGIAGHYAHTMA